MAKTVDLRICSSCGNIYSRKAGLIIIERCPVCNSGNREKIIPDT